MDSDDIIEPADAALQALLALTAERAGNQEKHDLIYDFILTCPPLHEWPTDSQDRLRDTCSYVIGLARSLRG